MPKGKIKCMICQGTGVITEDSNEYEFETRDPQTMKCLICNGVGYLGAFANLPDGTPARALLPVKVVKEPRKQHARLEVDKPVPIKERKKLISKKSWEEIQALHLEELSGRKKSKQRQAEKDVERELEEVPQMNTNEKTNDTNKRAKATAAREQLKKLALPADRPAEASVPEWDGYLKSRKQPLVIVVVSHGDVPLEELVSRIVKELAG